jgi:hypothetical protein
MSWSRWKQTIVKMSDLEAITHNLNIVKDKILKAQESRTPVSTNYYHMHSMMMMMVVLNALV